MLAKPFRLTRTTDFDRVRQQGRSWSDRRIVLCACANQLPHTRFGFIASKRVGNAVVRNRLRRLMREAVRLQRDLVAAGWDVVLIARHGLVDAPYALAEESLSRLLLQARLYRPDQILGGSPEQE